MHLPEIGYYAGLEEDSVNSQARYGRAKSLKMAKRSCDAAVARREAKRLDAKYLNNLKKEI
jgi:hypothetical protein